MKLSFETRHPEKKWKSNEREVVWMHLCRAGFIVTVDEKRNQS